MATVIRPGPDPEQAGGDGKTVFASKSSPRCTIHCRAPSHLQGLPRRLQNPSLLFSPTSSWVKVAGHHLQGIWWPSLVHWRVGLDDPQRSLPTPTILWFCDSVIRKLLRANPTRALGLHINCRHVQHDLLWLNTSLGQMMCPEAAFYPFPSRRTCTQVFTPKHCWDPLFFTKRWEHVMWLQ